MTAAWVFAWPGFYSENLNPFLSSLLLSVAERAKNLPVRFHGNPSPNGAFYCHRLPCGMADCTAVMGLRGGGFAACRLSGAWGRDVGGRCFIMRLVTNSCGDQVIDELRQSLQGSEALDLACPQISLFFYVKVAQLLVRLAGVCRSLRTRVLVGGRGGWDVRWSPGGGEQPGRLDSRAQG